MNLEVAGKIVLITGSSSGLGRSLATLYGAEGARVVVHYLSSRAGAEETADLVREAGGQSHIIQADVSSRGDMSALVARVADEWGPVQVLINNAVAFEGETPFGELAEDKLRLMWDVVVIGATNASIACLPGMQEAGWGRIVNISSRSGIMGAEGMSHYAAAKSALLGLTRTWAKELGPQGILVNAVAPTIMMTPAMLKSMPHKVQENLAKRNPLRRLASPEDVARLVLFLGSGWNTYVNGELITVGGGVMS